MHESSEKEEQTHIVSSIVVGRYAVVVLEVSLAESHADEICSLNNHSELRFLPPHLSLFWVSSIGSQMFPRPRLLR